MFTILIYFLFTPVFHIIWKRFNSIRFSTHGMSCYFKIVNKWRESESVCFKMLSNSLFRLTWIIIIKLKRLMMPNAFWSILCNNAYYQNAFIFYSKISILTFIWPDQINDTRPQNLFQQSIEKDIVWAIAGGLPDKEKRVALLGSSRSFQKESTIENMKKSKINYLLTIPKSPGYTVCKTYLVFLIGVMEVLELPYIFLHTDEQMYARGLHIIWKQRILRLRIILIMGNFYQLLVFQRVLFKRYNCLDLKDCWIQEELLSGQLVKRLKWDIITVQCVYMKKDLMLLFKEE